MTFETARFADGAATAAWLDAHSVEAPTEAMGKRLREWRKGAVADIFTLDRFLTDSNYGLWELPETVWLTATRHSDLRAA